MSINLLNFLTGNETILKVKCERYGLKDKYNHYIKVESEFPELVYIYFRRYEVGIINPFNKMEFHGIFCKNTNRYYGSSYLVHELQEEELEFSGIEFYTFGDGMESAVEMIRNKIRGLLPFETEKLSSDIELGDYQLKEAKNLAYNAYISSNKISTTDYADLYEGKMEYGDYDTFVHYLLNDEPFLDDIAKKFIEEKKEKFANRLAFTKRAIKELEELNRTNEYSERKKLIHSVDENMKTVQVTVRKDGKEISFKMENRIKPATTVIYDHCIVNASERAKYRELFGNLADVYIDDIVEIRYGRKTLYQKEVVPV